MDFLELIKHSKIENFFSSFRLSKIFINLIAGLSLAFVSYRAIKIYRLRKKYRHIPGPKTKGILGYFFGNVIEIANLPNGKIFHDLIVDWVKEYGHVFKFQLLDRMVIITVDPETIREVFITQNFPKHEDVYGIFGFPLKNARFLGNSLITNLDNEQWRHRRNLFNPSFHKQAIIGFMEEFNNKSDILMDKLRCSTDGKAPIKMLDELNNMTMDVIASVGFSMQIDSITKENNLKDYVSFCLEGFGRVIRDPTINITPSGYFFVRKYKKILKELRKLGEIQINSRLKQIQEGGYLADDLLSIMLKNNQNEQFEMDDLIDDFVTFFVAGQETTANLLSAALLEIGQRPDIFKKIRDEIDREIGLKSNLNYDDVIKLRYLNSVIKETLRLWSVVPFMSRKIETPIKICGYDIPVGSNVQVSSYISGRLEEFFPNNLDFDPERFYSNKNEIKNYTFYPFSVGPRNCIGQNFAMIEAKVFLVKFFQNFDFELDPNQSFKPAQFSTIRPADKTKCILKLRNL